MSDIISPKHYASSRADLQAIDVIEAFDLNYRLGNVMKYILRAGKKDDRRQDLEKALAYLHREVHGEWPTVAGRTETIEIKLPQQVVGVSPGLGAIFRGMDEVRKK